MKRNIIAIVMIVGVLSFACTKNADVKGNPDNEKYKEAFNKNKKEAENKTIVVNFYQKLFGDKDLSAIDETIGDTYIQHNPAAGDGKEALKSILTPFFTGAPKTKIGVQRVVAEDDLVVLHTRQVFGTTVNSVIDIFRLVDGKIMEHWDVIQAVPENPVSKHPMF
jgi:predicted SnoaL-like aldol condensation-catalyzing enzyme